MNTTAWKNFPINRPKDSDFPIWVMRPDLEGPRVFYKPHGRVTNFSTYQWMPCTLPKVEEPIFSFRVVVEKTYTVTVKGGDHFSARATVGALTANDLEIVGSLNTVAVEKPYLLPHQS